MDYLLYINIKQDLFLPPMAGPLLAISNRLPLIFDLLDYILLCFFIYSGYCFPSLLYLGSMLLTREFILLLFQSIAAGCVLCPYNQSFLLCKERL
jgi:hypothetical protein